MNIESFAVMIAKKAGNNLVTLLAYGSYAAGDRSKTSDINTLLALKDASPERLDEISPVIRKWQAAGNPVPLIFTRARVNGSADVFPMEFMDIKENNLLLAGEDLFKKIKISPKNLRLETERELQSALLRLRHAYINTAGDAGRLVDLMRDSVSTFVIILKSIIRLSGSMPPLTKTDIVRAAPKNLKLDIALFETLLELKDGRKAVKPGETKAYFKRYLAECEKIRDYAEKFRIKPGR